MKVQRQKLCRSMHCSGQRSETVAMVIQKIIPGQPPKINDPPLHIQLESLMEVRSSPIENGSQP